MNGLRKRSTESLNKVTYSTFNEIDLVFNAVYVIFHIGSTIKLVLVNLALSAWLNGMTNLQMLLL